MGDRELMVSFISANNRCEFCAVAHSALAAAAAGDQAWVRSVLEGQEAAAERPELRGMLDFLEKLTLQPWEIGRDDIERLRGLGLSDRAMEEATMIGFLFAMGNRAADMLGFDIPTAETLRRAVASAAIRLQGRYRLTRAPPAQ